jgi:hypothetical protein
MLPCGPLKVKRRLHPHGRKTNHQARSTRESNGISTTWRVTPPSRYTERVGGGGVGPASHLGILLRYTCEGRTSHSLYRENFICISYFPTRYPLSNLPSPEGRTDASASLQAGGGGSNCPRLLTCILERTAAGTLKYLWFSSVPNSFSDCTNI